MTRPALLVIDIQNLFLPEIHEPERETRLRMIEHAIRLFRDNGFPVVGVYHSDPLSGPRPGTEAFEFPHSVGIRTQDPKIIKSYPNAFKRTDLDPLLRRLGCDTLFLCGLNAVYCVLATYHGAADLNYDAFLVKSAVMSHNPSHTRFVEETTDAVGLKAMRVIVKLAGK